MINSKIQLKYDLLTLYKGSGERLSTVLEEGKKLWYGIIRLIITLSSSFLLLSFALIDKLFNTKNGIEIPAMLIWSWFFLLISIILAIMQEIEGTVFYNRVGADIDRKMHKYAYMISKGDTHIFIDKDPYGIIYSNILWGVAAINSFLIALILITVSLLTKAMSLCILYKGILFSILVVLLGLIDFHFLSKYNKTKKRKEKIEDM